MKIPGLRRCLAGSSCRDAVPEGRRNITVRATIALASVFVSLFAMTEAEAQIPGLIHYYPGDVDGSDTVGTNPGTFENEATAGTPALVGGAFQFDGIDDGVDLGNVPDLDYSATSSFTWEAWINSFGLTSQSVQYVLTTNYACSPTAQVLQIYNSGANAGKVAFVVRDANDVASVVTTPFPLSSNMWHHLVAVRDVTPEGKFIYLYVDCALVASAPDVTTATLASNASDFIGRRFLCPDRSTFNGLIDEVRFYDRALTQEEVAEAVAGAVGNADTDGDGLLDSTEIEMSCPGACPSFSNPDSDGDTVSDGAEVAGGTNPCSEDSDSDGVADHSDNCLNTWNPTQSDVDGDGIGDACDDDFDNDGVLDEVDNCPHDANSNQADMDVDNIGDACDNDDDNDGVLDAVDNCPVVANSNQGDFDGDGLGDACESDDDNDGVLDGVDACPGTPAGGVVNVDGCTIAALCPCENPWKSHGDYVSCVARTAGTFVAAGLITEVEKGAIVAEAAQSNCGSKE